MMKSILDENYDTIPYAFVDKSGNGVVVYRPLAINVGAWEELLMEYSHTTTFEKWTDMVTRIAGL